MWNSSTVFRRCIFLAHLCLPLVAHSITVVDDRGVAVSFERSPQRIVSLLPSLTETVCALDQCHRLVGVDRYSNYPAMVQRLPQVGGGLDPSIEAILTLRPDVVLMATSAQFADRLQSLGIKIIALEPKTHADVQRVLLQLGQLLAVHHAPTVWRAIDAGVSAAAESLPPSVRGKRVYFEVNEAPYAASESSFIGETLTRLGVKNIVPSDLGPFPKLNPEYVVRANPDLIMLSQTSAAGLAQRPGWKKMKALKEQRVCRFSVAQSDVLVRAGPQMAQAARYMANCLARHFPSTQKPHQKSKP